jgi:hypothetical protein
MVLISINFCLWVNSSCLLTLCFSRVALCQDSKLYFVFVCLHFPPKCNGEHGSMWGWILVIHILDIMEISQRETAKKIK